jgi:hypothetical protein
MKILKIMNNMDKYYRYNHFQIINNQVRGHCFKYFKEITRQLHNNRVQQNCKYLPSEIMVKII